MNNLLVRIGRLAFVVILGICLIVYIGLAIVYMQQAPKREDLETQINKTFLIVSKRLPSMAELQAEYDNVTHALKPLPVSNVLEKIVGIARESGINVDPASGKFNIPAPAKQQKKKMAVGTYEIISFLNIKAQGDYENVMAFLSDLGSGGTQQTLVLKRVKVSPVEIRFQGEEADRRTEFRQVLSAVSDMMADNDITSIPNPINYKDGTAVNDMTAFPDIATTLYYYTCEADGTVRQFDGPDIATATEYFGSEEAEIEIEAILDVDLYSKPVKE